MKTILCPKCGAALAPEADGTMPRHPFKTGEMCPAAERGALIRSLLAANIKVEQAGEYLRLSNQLVFDPYTGRWFLGHGATRIEGGMLPASLPLEERIQYLLELCETFVGGVGKPDSIQDYRSNRNDEKLAAF